MRRCSRARPGAPRSSPQAASTAAAGPGRQPQPPPQSRLLTTLGSMYTSGSPQEGCTGGEPRGEAAEVGGHPGVSSADVPGRKGQGLPQRQDSPQSAGSRLTSAARVIPVPGSAKTHSKSAAGSSHDKSQQREPAGLIKQHQAQQQRPHGRQGNHSGGGSCRARNASQSDWLDTASVAGGGCSSSAVALQLSPAARCGGADSAAATLLCPFCGVFLPAAERDDHIAAELVAMEDAPWEDFEPRGVPATASAAESDGCVGACPQGLVGARMRIWRHARLV